MRTTYNTTLIYSSQRSLQTVGDATSSPVGLLWKNTEQGHHKILPPAPRPFLLDGKKKPPKTKYSSTSTSKKVCSHVHTASEERNAGIRMVKYVADTSSSTDGAEGQHDDEILCMVTNSGDRECSFDKSSDEDNEAAEKLMLVSNSNQENAEDDDDEDDEVEHLPAGQSSQASVAVIGKQKTLHCFAIMVFSKSLYPRV